MVAKRRHDVDTERELVVDPRHIMVITNVTFYGKELSVPSSWIVLSVRLGASANVANSALPNAVPARPHPPSVASATSDLQRCAGWPERSREPKRMAFTRSPFRSPSTLQTAICRADPAA